MARKSKEDWLAAGVQVLNEEGAAGLTIERLCERLGVTKGSFYHHWGGYDTFKASLLEYFEREGTLNIIEQVESAQTPLEKLKRLQAIIVRYSAQTAQDPEVAFRAWALQDTAVRAVQTRIDQRRMDYVQTLLAALVPDAEQAQRMTRLLYLIVVGSEQVQPPIRGDDLQALFEDYLRLYQLEESPNAGEKS